MKLYKKINQYLVHHFPTLWNTQFVWILILGLVMHLLTYAMGYNYVNIFVMKKYSFFTVIFKSNYFSLYLILSLLLLIYLSVQFFSHNPLKSFYSIPKYYLTRVASILLPISMLWMMLPVTFQQAARDKVLSITSTKEMISESRAFEQMKPLLFQEKETYHITKREYPAPFPLDEWNKYHNKGDEYPMNKKDPFVTLNDVDYQFGNIKDIDPDTCKAVMQFQPVDVKAVYGLSEYSLYNYPATSESDSKDFTARLHRFYSNKEKDSLIKIYNDGIAVMKKYRIKNDLNPSKMTELLLEQDLNKKQILITGTQNEYNDEITFSDTNVLNKYYYNNYEFEEITSFHNSALRAGYFSNDWFWITLFLSLIFISTLISIKHIPLIPIVISISITGILGILTGLIFVAADKINVSDKSMIYLGIAISLSVILAALYFIYKGRLKKIAQFSILPLIAGSIGLVTGIFALIHKLSEYTITLPCNEGIEHSYSYESHPSHFLFPAILIVFLLFHAIRYVHARSDNS